MRRGPNVATAHHEGDGRKRAAGGQRTTGAGSKRAATVGDGARTSSSSTEGDRRSQVGASRPRRRAASKEAEGGGGDDDDVGRSWERTLSRYAPDGMGRDVVAEMAAPVREARDWHNARASGAPVRDPDRTTTADPAEGEAPGARHGHHRARDRARAVNQPERAGAALPESPPSCPASSSASRSSRSASGGASRGDESATTSEASVGASDDIIAGPDGACLREARAAINFTKSVLMGRYVPPHASIADIGCGRGADAAKMAYSRPRRVLFVDGAEAALIEAERRWRRARFPYPAAFLHDDFCSPRFLAMGARVAVHRDDPLREPGRRHAAVVDEVLDARDGADLVDAVSCQFAAHYAFWSREAARTFVANVRRVLRPGGVFLGIAPDAERVLALADDEDADDDGAASGSRVRVRLARPLAACARRHSHAIKTDPRGASATTAARSHVEHTFALCGGVMEACRQYTMDHGDLRDLCVEAGLTPLLSIDLTTFFDLECINPRNASMLERMGAPAALDDADDRRHMGLYRAFVFVRVVPAALRRPLVAPAALRRPLVAPAGASDDVDADTGPADDDRDARARGDTAQPVRGRAISAMWSTDASRAPV
jgi:SAM-dependent methyltransferase